MTRARDLADLIAVGGSLPAATSIGDVSSTELGYLDGVTSALQAQIDTKTAATSGSFTPVMTIGGSSTGITYSDQVGYYYQIGDLFTYILRTKLSSKGGLTGPVSITGVPESPPDRFSSVSYEASPVIYWNLFSYTGEVKIIHNQNGDLQLFKVGGGSSFNTVIDGSDLTDSSDLRVQGFFAL